MRGTPKPTVAEKICIGLKLKEIENGQSNWLGRAVSGCAKDCPVEAMNNMKEISTNYKLEKPATLDASQEPRNTKALAECIFQRVPDQVKESCKNTAQDGGKKACLTDHVLEILKGESRKMKYAYQGCRQSVSSISLQGIVLLINHRNNVGADFL